jgi:ABC-type multidrug transport system fused ATPase/permease subunit
MTDIILGGPPIPLYNVDNLIYEINEIDDEIYKIINLLSQQYNISSTDLHRAYKVFTDITGHDQTLHLTQNADVIRNTELMLVNATATYVSILVGIVAIIIIWILAILGLYSWVVALILTFVIILFLIILTFSYKSHCDKIIEEQNSRLQNISDNALENFKNSISHWPRGLYNALISLNDNIDDNIDVNNNNNNNNNNNTNNNNTNNNIDDNNNVNRGCNCGR